eukprot:EG_transcript_33881
MSAEEVAQLEKEVEELRASVRRLEEEALARRGAAQQMRLAEQMDTYYSHSLGAVEKLFGVRFGPRDDLQPNTVQFSLAISQGSEDTVLFVKMHFDPAAPAGPRAREVEVLDCHGVLQPRFSAPLAAALGRPGLAEQQLARIVGTICDVHHQANT